MTHRKVRLIDIADFQNGHAFYKDGYSDEGYLAIDLFNVGEDGRLRFADRDKYVSNEVASKYAKFVLNKGDLVIVMTDMTQSLGILGKCAFIDSDNRYVLNQRIGRIVPNAELVNPYYLYLFINSNSFRKPLHSIAKGAVQKYINTGDIKDNLVDLPSRETQNRIVDIVKEYDDLILNNEKRIQILEEMAQGLYEEWFVHFRFPGHEEVKMVDSELGKIPEGWEVVQAEEVIEFDPTTKVDKDKENIYVPMGSVSESSMVISNLETRKGNSGSKFSANDTLLARISPSLENGKTGYVDFLDEGETAFGSTEFIVMRSKGVCPEYVYCLARSQAFRRTAIKSMVGATGRQRVRRIVLEQYKLIIPTNKAAIDSFHEITSPMFRLVSNLSKKNEALTKTRDLLLPKLISGEVEI